MDEVLDRHKEYADFDSWQIPSLAMEVAPSVQGRGLAGRTLTMVDKTPTGSPVVGLEWRHRDELTGLLLRAARRFAS